MTFAKIAFIVGMVLMTVIRAPFAQRVQKEKATQEKGNSAPQDREEQLVLLLLTIGSLLLPLIYIFTGWLDFANFSVPVWVYGIGVILMIVGLWLFWRSHADLGRNWSSTLEIYDQHELVTNGVYGYIRHPMYAAMWLITIAQALLLSNWIAGLGGIISFAVMYFLRIPKEERMMMNAFGEQYQRYMATTGRVIPKLGVNK